MRAEPSTKKRAVNMTIDSATLDLAKKIGMNVSKTVDAFLKDEVKRRYWEQWNEQNKEAIDSYNARITKEGLPLAKCRSF